MFPIQRSLGSGRDPDFMESISKTMRVPERLSVGPGQDQDQNQDQTEAHPVYSMQVPDRLTYAAADLSPRPQFGPKSKIPALEVCLESPLEAPHRDAPQSPIRRSMSDQSFARTPPGTPAHNRALVLPRQHYSPSRRPVHRPPASPQLPPVEAPEPPFSPLSARSVMQLGLRASQRLLQAVNRKYRFVREAPPPPQTPPRPETAPGQVQDERGSRRLAENWSVEEEGGAAVELIVLRRQVLKMSRRLAALERHNHEHKNTEFVLFSLLGSACLLNVWLWLRR
ncbi:mitochondrial fission factor-like isoform X2 [Eucyclogobius newberryi]|uniref:mitochondrial fission factor-like isoform X2 n=1 Tax=Eucyclogobius newberryi TaxID=166745 RepID=UPI003B5BCBA4